MEIKEAPATVYAESTPNPATMKFVASKLLVEHGGTVEYTDPDQTENAPLAARLFNFPFVSGLFFASNFVTIAKNDLVEWDDIVLEMREFIQDYLRSGKPVFQGDPAAANRTASQKAGASSPAHAKPQTETEQQIVEVLEEYVRPAVEGDGGAIHFKSYKDGVVTVTLRGACSGCPSSMITLKSGIETLMQRMVPEVKEVVAEEL